MPKERALDVDLVHKMPNFLVYFYEYPVPEVPEDW